MSGRPDIRKRRASARGVTLVEMLVTIGVVSLLLGLLLPVVSTARRSARSMACQSNLRQMALAATQYSAVWGRYPVALRYAQVDGVAHRVAWDWVTTFSGDAVIGPGALWSFAGDPDRTMQCPAYHGPSTAFTGDPFTGYNYNTSYIGGEATAPAFGWDVVRRGARPGACERSSTCAMFGCGGYANGTNKFMRAPGNPEGTAPSVTWAGGQAFRHVSDSTNVSYVDGHVGVVTRAHPGGDATMALLDDVMGFPRNGFLSDDDSAYAPW